MLIVVKEKMRASEFLPEKINPDSLKPGQKFHKKVLGKYNLFAQTKDDPEHPGDVQRAAHDDHLHPPWRSVARCAGRLRRCSARIFEGFPCPHR